MLASVRAGLGEQVPEFLQRYGVPGGSETPCGNSIAHSIAIKVDQRSTASGRKGGIERVAAGRVSFLFEPGF